jgi:hypothetical protein
MNRVQTHLFGDAEKIGEDDLSDISDGEQR